VKRQQDREERLRQVAFRTQFAATQQQQVFRQVRLLGADSGAAFDSTIGKRSFPTCGAEALGAPG